MSRPRTDADKGLREASQLWRDHRIFRDMKRRIAGGDTARAALAAVGAQNHLSPSGVANIYYRLRRVETKLAGAPQDTTAVRFTERVACGFHDADFRAMPQRLELIKQTMAALHGSVPLAFTTAGETHHVRPLEAVPL
ncbi:MAG: hypothetical protein OXI15_14035 [Chromatiales bacterium]|nr:hypothetical protein [Chromatiales bacterium]